MKTIEEKIERRNFARFPLRLPMAVRHSVGESETETANISAVGVLFELAEELAIGSPIEFAITLPSADLGTPGDVRVECVGRVVRCSPDGERQCIAALIDDYGFERIHADDH